MEWMQIICNTIIIIGGAIMAIKNVSEWFGKPIQFFKKKSDKVFEGKVRSVLDEYMEEYFDTFEFRLDKKYLLKEDKSTLITSIESKVLTEIKGELGQVSQLTTQYEALAISAKDVLREKIVCLYENNKDTRTLRYFERRALDQYYKDYKAMGGNSYIDIIYNRMITWDVIPDDYQ